MKINEHEDSMDALYGVIVLEIAKAQLNLLALEQAIDFEGYSCNTDSISDILVSRDGQSLQFNFTESGNLTITLYECIHGKVSETFLIENNEEFCVALIKSLTHAFFFKSWHEFVPFMKIKGIDSALTCPIKDIISGSKLTYL